jgi:hypothetical protein
MIRVAYVVYFQDNVKKIVPIEEIKDLRPPKNICPSCRPKPTQLCSLLVGLAMV